MLEINLEFRKGILFIRLEGSLIKETISLFKDTIKHVVKENGIRYIVFNINGLNKIDDYGIKALQNSHKITKENNGNSLICSIKEERIKQKIKKSRLEEYIYEVSDELAAFNIINLKG